ncbi:hypothetical protein GQ42DRAFT_2326 [Ramicandelaber brevisporus]|nr:hypothetical protein GQ42DRAFT_2326 [Ramicandelaber brevisporus]
MRCVIRRCGQCSTSPLHELVSFNSDHILSPFLRECSPNKCIASFSKAYREPC